MTDERLRELRQGWEQTAAVEDEAALLIGRVRAGEISRERVALASYCGHPAALRAALGEPSLLPFGDDWVGAFVREGITATDRLMLACCRVCARRLPASTEEDRRFSLRQVIDAIEGWIATSDPSGFMPVLVGWSKSHGAHEAVLGAAWSVAQSVEPEKGVPIHNDLLAALERTREFVGEAELLTEVQSELVPWLLGYHDPVANRASERG